MWLIPRLDILLVFVLSMTEYALYIQRSRAELMYITSYLESYEQSRDKNDSRRKKWYHFTVVVFVNNISFGYDVKTLCVVLK